MEYRHFRLIPILLWLVFLLWSLAQLPVFASLEARGQSSIDFLAYRRAAAALERGESPYQAPEQSQRIWRFFHQSDADQRAAYARGQGPQQLRAFGALPQQPGPYVYPPTLALLIAQLHISMFAFAVLTLLSILGFGWLWLSSAQAHSVWLLLIICSWDVIASLYGGNVELLLLFAALLAARLLWDAHPLLAAPLVALVLLIKPFYALFFAAFGLLQLVRQAAPRRETLRTLALAAVLALALIALEAYRWGPALRAETLRYLAHALDYQWFALPVAEQTPMSAWNRTPMQGLIAAGMPAATAQFGALMLWLLLTAITLWRAYGARLSFPLAFALAFVLLYWGRPVGWVLSYLEIVVVAAAWPALRRWQRLALGAGAAALMLSHWWALALTIQGAGFQLLTLQSAALPLETWLVLPIGWIVVLGALTPIPLSRCGGRGETRRHA